jgi:hypothetical protein
MPLYTNHTRFGAIVTIQIDTTDVPEAALEIGQGDYYEHVSGSKGVHDYFVDAGKELRTAGNTSAIFMGARNVG